VTLALMPWVCLVQRLAQDLFRANEGEDDGYDCHRSNADGEHQRHWRTRQGLTPPHGPLIGFPVEKAGDGNESTERNHRQPEDPTSAVDIELRQELGRGDAGGDKGQGRSIPRQERSFVGVREPCVGFLFVRVGVVNHVEATPLSLSRTHAAMRYPGRRVNRFGDTQCSENPLPDSFLA